MRLALGFAAAALLLLPAAAQAEPTATFEVTVVKGSDKDGPADPRLNGAVKGQLAKLRFRSYEVLSQSQRDVKQGGKETVSVPGGQTVTVSLVGRDGGAVKVETDVPGKGRTTSLVRTGGVLVVNVTDDVLVPLQLVRVK